MASNQQILSLVRKVLMNSASTEDYDQLLKFMEDDPEGSHAEAITELLNAQNTPEQETLYDFKNWDLLGRKILQSDNQVSLNMQSTPKFRFFRIGWMRYAAAVIFIAGVVTYLLSTNPRKPIPVETVVKVEDIPAPVSNRATLTLAGGQQIFLDSAGNGLLAIEGKVNVQKTKDGRIVYDAGGANKEKTQYNTLYVPRGSQVTSIVLSDGSVVHLNSASSLKYPVAFSDGERRVEIIGEAYFEIAKDAKRKFIVVGGGVQTEVLGTEFNVNAYPDEANTKVSLLEGSIRVKAKDGQTIIKPGQQVQTSAAGGFTVNDQIDLMEVTAWKRGLFEFNEENLDAILRQVSRWFNIDIRYESKKEGTTYSGGLSRKSPLSEVIKLLKANNIECRLEGNILIINE